ncbi:hypothetical protein MRB53_007736 [Persea americana]|uniref:Uncharacterized protein n=1 Tax=Persea americana TaxID=3435 RepID=A0ACC2MKT7_PERAE|nr:hypothetical protein MRB53_007736 [Persea americana]
MVATRFSWPHGGRRVFLSGSFNRWSEHLPMSLVEGSSTVFQRICDLPPGFYKYKFLVDGIWRHDRQQHHVTEENGTVNNHILVEELELFTSVLRPRTSIPGPNNNLVNGVFQHLPSSSSGTHQEPMMRISDADINISRQRFSILLSRYTAYELLPDSGKVFALDVGVPMKHAFHIMSEQGLVVVPILDDCTGQLFGMLTASDFILILRELHKNGSILTNEELETHSILAWKEGKLRLNRNSDGHVTTFRRPLIQASPFESLKDLALRIMQNEISTVPIVHSSMQEGSCVQLLHVACLAGILKYICRHFRHSPGSLPVLQQPVFGINIGTWASEVGRESRRQLAILRSNASLSFALTLLMEAQVSSIPILDDNGSLLDLYSRSDITALAKGGVYAHIQLDQTSMHQALQLTYEANGINIGSRRCQTCFRSDSLHVIMERLSDPAVRRLVVIDSQTERVEGIISLRDVFNLLLS